MSIIRPKLKTVQGAPSWRLASDQVEAWLTRHGGHLAPVSFRLGRKTIQPYAIAPWSPDDAGVKQTPVLQTLRGDFFCCPFGGNAEAWRGERHPVHGETASAAWSRPVLRRESGAVELKVEMTTRTRPGRVTKLIRLREGETSVYCRHTLSGYHGPMGLGHHAMLRFPAAEGAGLVALSPFSHGLVLPVPFEEPALGGYSSLRIGGHFRRLDRVPLATGGHTDLSRYPARAGYEDLVMVSSRPAPFAWTAVSFPEEGYLWFGLKDPRVLRSTVLWHSNGGRHYPPWNGRHRRVLGLEEVTANFHLGLAASARPNPLNRAGVPTALMLTPQRPLVVNYIMGVVAIPRSFGPVVKVSRLAGVVAFNDRNGRSVQTALDWTFLRPDFRP